LWVLLGLIAVMALLPMVASPYALLLMLPFFGYDIALLGFNLLFGTTGLLSFGHALFLGVGAYTAAALTSKFGVLSLEVLLMTAALVSGLISLVIGVLCVRYTRIFFGMLTLAFGMLFHSFLFKFYSITGGDQGMRVLRPLLLGMEWRGGKTAFLTGPFYYYALVLFALLGLMMWRITQSPFGLHLRAIRENAGKAAYVGVQIFRMRLAAFVISAIYGGIGGTILAVTTGLADPELAYWTHSGNLVFMAVLGGSGTFAGPAIGALVFVVLQDFVMSVTQYWRFVMGSVLVLLVVFMRRGCRARSSFSPTGAMESGEMQPDRAPVPGTAPLFETINVSKSFGAFKALCDISFGVSDGEFVSIVGPNGAGKTTLVNVVTGLLRPTVGEVRFLGRDIAGIGPVELARLGMSRAFQLVNIFPALTVRETLGVAVASRLRRVSNPFRSLKRDAVLQADTERVADVLGLRAKLDTVASTLSQGEKKLLDIASAFALNPTVILLDEPTSGVSSGDKHAIMEVLVTAAKAAGVRAIVQVEHDMDLVERYSHRIVALQAGTLLADMAPDAFFADPAMISAVVGTRPRA
ncbi:MAG: branched-chain amino acid ABC transporter ATP-binding protein/permease, partial [Xanthobacteraceae bacterium]